MKTLLENADFIEITDDEKEKVVGGDSVDIAIAMRDAGSQVSGNPVGVPWVRYC